MKPNQQLSNKDKAVSFLELVVAGEVRVAFDKYIGENFLHHNPYFKGDRDSLMVAMEENEETAPDKIFDVKRVIEDGEEVAVHSHIKQNPEDLGAAVVHIFRFQDGRIVEAWDIGQAVPEDSPNENGVF
ncbi:nuclear transport factor 2 family protein [Guptibacillus algicola]|uniref:nuclear transport factor 2 family protein n=1 Tax=Guptibacillus algicola TaxID=225844 RepID=UPI001CD1CB42|nr:nuclear transport factor 2 family protein [Alkalihalobacillus algicola]MCA0987216.1 nuclear transport factor 2 family protein [Alkalihalobacillus algicola]